MKIIILGKFVSGYKRKKRWYYHLIIRILRIYQVALKPKKTVRMFGDGNRQSGFKGYSIRI